MGCKTLKSIIIGKSVTNIEVRAFGGCKNLKSITIPNSVSVVGGYIFSGCESLTSLTFLGDAPKGEYWALYGAAPIIYRKPDAKGWGDTWSKRPVKLISEKP